MCVSLLEWNKAYSLGINEFDEHHKHLIELLNKTYSDYILGADNDELAVVLDKLVDYATYHFAAEERWMKECRYPGRAEHICEHEVFILRVLDFYRDFNNGTAQLSLEIFQFLNSWLTSHILESDAEYGRFAKGIPHE
jgi:hemerythrin